MGSAMDASVYKSRPVAAPDASGAVEDTCSSRKTLYMPSHQKALGVKANFATYTARRNEARTMSASLKSHDVGSALDAFNARASPLCKRSSSARSGQSARRGKPAAGLVQSVAPVRGSVIGGSAATFGFHSVDACSSRNILASIIEGIRSVRMLSRKNGAKMCQMA